MLVCRQPVPEPTRQPDSGLQKPRRDDALNRAFGEMATARARANEAGYELAERTSEDERRSAGLDPVRKDVPFDDGLSDDDEVEQLLTAGRPRLSGKRRSEDDKTREESTGEETASTTSKRRGSGASTKDRGFVARMTGGMTAQQRRRFASEMTVEVCSASSINASD